jgi:putative endonuclease
MPILRNWLRRAGLGRSLGARGERLAARHLRTQGYHILARNLRTRAGEIDLVAQGPDKRQIVIVEVKSALAPLDGRPADPRPEEHVNHQKQRRLTALACQVVRRYKLEHLPIRFDVIGVEFPPHGEPVIRHHPGAFESTV